MPGARSPKHEIVVALAHHALVRSQLADWGITDPTAEISHDLGLARLELDPQAVSAAAGLASGAANDLDRLLARLYDSFAAGYGGWVPTFGKNRVVERVVASHTIGGGDEGQPTVLGSLAWPAPGQLGTGVEVAVADTAVAARPQLVGRFIANDHSLLAGHHDSPADPAAGHATFVSGLVLLNAPGATLRVERVLDDSGLSDSWSVAKHIVRLGRSGVDILNLSLGCFTDDNRPPLVLSTALDRLDPAVLVIAAAGNHGHEYPSRPLWPAALDEVVAVGAVDAEGSPVAWSPQPRLNPWVDVLAGGHEVESTYLSGDVALPGASARFTGFARWSGTSFAAARVSGMVAARADAHGSPAAALRELVAAASRRDGLPWLG